MPVSLGNCWHSYYSHCSHYDNVTCKQNNDTKWHQDLVWIIHSPACTFSATSFLVKCKFCRISFSFENELTFLGLFCSISHPNVNRVQMDIAVTPSCSQEPALVPLSLFLPSPSCRRIKPGLNLITFNWRYCQHCGQYSHLRKAW